MYTGEHKMALEGKAKIVFGVLNVFNVSNGVIHMMLQCHCILSTKSIASKFHKQLQTSNTKTNLK